MSILKRLYNVARGNLMAKGTHPVRVRRDPVSSEPPSSEPPSSEPVAREPVSPDLTPVDVQALPRTPKKRNL